MELGIEVAEPRGEEFVVVPDGEGAAWQSDQVDVQVVPDEERQITVLQPSRVGHVRVPAFELTPWSEYCKRIEWVLRREPFQEAVTWAEAQPVELDCPVCPGRSDSDPRRWVVGCDDLAGIASRFCAVGQQFDDR